MTNTMTETQIQEWIKSNPEEAKIMQEWMADNFQLVVNELQSNPELDTASAIKDVNDTNIKSFHTIWDVKSSNPKGWDSMMEEMAVDVREKLIKEKKEQNELLTLLNR